MELEELLAPEGDGGGWNAVEDDCDTTPEWVDAYEY